MSIGSWYDNDGLLRQYGTQKANPTTAGDYLSYGDTREIEVVITLANLTTTANLIALTTFMPAGTNTFIEEVVVETEVGMVVNSGATGLSVGLGYIPASPTYSTIGNASLPSVTSISDTAFVAGATFVNSLFTTAGQKQILTAGSTGAGAYIGAQSTQTAQANYLTAKAVGGTYSSGLVRVRIRYRGIGTISQ